MTGGTKVLSDRVVIRITAERGHTFLDRMITLVEGANRQKTPNEIALTILLAVLTIIFIPVVVVAPALRQLRRGQGLGGRLGGPLGLPHPDHHRGPALGHRHRRHGPAGPAQRPGHERPGRRGGGRRPDAAARQDRHHHPGQPDGLGLLPGRRPHRGRRWPTPPSWRRWPTRRPRAAPSWCWPRSGSASASASLSGEHTLRPLLGHHPDVRASTSTAARSARARPRPCAAGSTEQGGTPPDAGRDRRSHRPGRVHPAGRGRRPDDPRGDRAEGRGEAGHPGEVRRDAGRWASAR